MKVGAIRGAVNHAVTSATETVHKTAKNPSAVKKVLQIATKIFALIDLTYHKLNSPRDRKLTGAMKGTIDIIDFYGTFKDVMFWINPFSKETLDEEALAKSLKSTLCDPITDTKQHALQEKKADKIVKDLLKAEEFYSKSEVRAALALSLQKSGFKSKAAHEIAAKIIIKQKARPITLLFSMACFTTADVVGNVMTLGKWGLVDLAKIAAKIGTHSPVFMFVIELGAETVLGSIASAGLIVMFSEATYRMIKNAIKIYQSKALTDPKHKEEAYKELKKALLDMLSTGTDLVYTAAPLLFVINPPVITVLAIVAKGTGLICILVKAYQ